MSLPSISLRRPVFATVCSITIIVFGLIGFKFLGVREYPAIDPPVITVKTVYTGADAEVIESQITEPLEKAINGVQGIRSLSSTSTQGQSTITVEFNLGSDLETAANDVRDKVALAIKQLPNNIDAPPVVTKADANSDAILSVTLSSDTRSILEVDDYAENVVAERLQTISDVSTIQIWGQKQYAMRLYLDPAKLASYSLTSLDIKAAVQKENVQLPAGKLSGSTMELQVNARGRLTSVDDFNNLIIKSDSSRIVRLKDVGTATLGAVNEETTLNQSGVPMIGMGIVPQPGANYIDIADEFYKRLELIKSEIPKDYKLNVVLDNTKFIRQSITEVQETLLLAILLVVLIIYLFFRDWLMALRPLIDIPVSLIGAFFIMYLFGYSINILTLLAIVLATGLVVDDGIVVTENIYKKLEGGLPIMEAARKGSEEIYFAVISTSITLAVVFMPIIFLSGFTGHLFREFGVVMAGAVLISAFVSLTLTPVLNIKLRRKNNSHSKFYHRTEKYFVAMIDGYKNALENFMRRRWLALPIIGVCVLMIYFIGKLLPSELAPLDDRSLLRVSVTAPEGTSYDFMYQFMNTAEQFIIDSVPERKLDLNIVAPGFTGSGAVNTGMFRIKLSEPDERKRTQAQIANYLQGKLSAFFPDAQSFVIQEQTISVGVSARTSLPVQFVIKAADPEKLRTAVPAFLAMANKDSVFSVATVNLKYNKPQLNVRVDRDKAKTLGLSVFDIFQTLQTAYGGQNLDYFTMKGKQYQIIQQLNRENRTAPIDLKTLYVRNNNGQLIQLDNVVTILEDATSPQLFHYNRYESATISAGLAPGQTIGDGLKEMNKIADQVLDKSFSTDVTGASRDFAESSSDIQFAFILALILIYLVLAAQFESFIDPFIIMLTVPMALAGGVLVLWYFNQTLNIFSEIGLLVLVGLVTKNGILIVEFANQQQEKGMKKMEAVITASALRLRPILMTSLATALGALPIALAIGAGAKSRMSMGIVIIGGLLFALILTLFVIPAMYSFIAKEQKHDKE